MGKALRPHSQTEYLSYFSLKRMTVSMEHMGVIFEHWFHDIELEIESQRYGCIHFVVRFILRDTIWANKVE